MKSLRSTLLAGAAVALVAGPASAAPQGLILAQAQTSAPLPEAVLAAQVKVDAARGVLRDTIAKGGNAAQARAALAAALRELDAARAAAGLPPSGETVDAGGQPPAGQPPAGQAGTGQPPGGAGGAPAAKGGPPAAGQAIIPPAIVPPPGGQPPAGQAVIPPQGGQPPAVRIIPPGGNQPPGGQPPAGQAVIPSQGGQAPAAKIIPPPASGATPPAGQAVVPPGGAQPPGGQPPAGQPPAGQAVVPPPGAPPGASGQAVLPPPVFLPGQKFDPKRFGPNRPRFGENQPEDKAVVLPQTEAAIKEGQQVQAQDGRTIVKQGGQVVIQHDDAQRFRRQGYQIDTRPGPDGTFTTTINGPGGTQVVTIKDRNGTILQRYRKNPNGSIEVLIGAVQAPPQGGFKAPPPPPKLPPPQVSFDFSKRLPPIVVRIPRQDYIVESSRASPMVLQQTFAAPPVEQIERPYSLEEIRRSARLRDKVRRIDFDTVTFEFGSAVLPDDQIPQVQAIGDAIRNVLATDPSAVFLIEGHTDAVGSDIANLALSDRRAETVAEILSYYFGVPPENLVTQGYGEQYLKVPTVAAERQNRRVAFRNITPLMRIGAK